MYAALSIKRANNSQNVTKPSRNQKHCLIAIIKTTEKFAKTEEMKGFFANLRTCSFLEIHPT